MIGRQFLLGAFRKVTSFFSTNYLKSRIHSLEYPVIELNQIKCVIFEAGKLKASFNLE